MSTQRLLSLRNGQAIPRNLVPELSEAEFRRDIVAGVSAGQRIAALFGTRRLAQLPSISTPSLPTVPVRSCASAGRP